MTDRTWKWLGVAAIGLAAAAVGTAVILKIQRDRENCCTECICDEDFGPVASAEAEGGASETKQKQTKEPYPAEKASGAEVAQEEDFSDEV